MRKKKEAKRASQTEVRPEVIIQKQTEIVPVPAIEIAAPPTTEAVLQQAQRQIEIRKGYIALIARELRPHDVIVFGGKDSEEIYLPKQICMKILSWARVAISFDGPMEEHHYNSPDGEFIEFVISATVRDGTGHPAPILGNRSTRDEFFGTAGTTRQCPVCKKEAVYDFPFEGAKWRSYHCPEHPKEKPEKQVHYLPLWDVDIASVRQAAVSNLWNHAIEAIGLRPNLQDLKEAGMDISKVQRIGFGFDREAASHATDGVKAVATSEAGATTSTPQARVPSPAPQKQPEASKPPKAEIPGPENHIKGTIEQIIPGTTKKKSAYFRIVVAGVHHFLFDNKEMKIDGDTKMRLFDILKEAKVGMPCEFIVQNKPVGDKTLSQVTVMLHIGNLEWEPDGIPVIRREPPAEQMPLEEAGYHPSDEDIPF